ncbi:hypothetical protein Tco_0007822 [Tanacetum coccineum]
MSYSKQTHLVNYPEDEIHSDSNIVPYSQYLIETQNAAVQDTNSSAQQDAMILSVFEQLSNQVTNCNKVNKDNLIANESLSTELERYKERVFKNESKEKGARNIDKEIALENKVKELDNIGCKMGQSMQTVHMITKPQVFYDNNLKQALGFQNPFYLKKVKHIRPMLYEDQFNIKPIHYAKLNRLSEDFGKHFVPQQKLSDEQAFRLQTSHHTTDQSASSPVNIEAPQELPKVSLVNTSLIKLKYHLGQFDNVVKKRIMPDALTEGEWGFEHTKGVFLNEIIPFLKTLKDIFYVFDKDLLIEKQFLIENDRLLDQIIAQDIVNIIVNSSMNINASVNVNSSVAMNDSVNYMEMCNMCLELEAELIKQHNMNNTFVNQTEPTFDQLFELNNLKSELQAKETIITKLKAHIKRVNATYTSESVKKDFDEIKTINIELEHRVTKLIAENENLKRTSKQLYDSIKPSRVRAKEQADSLVN